MYLNYQTFDYKNLASKCLLCDTSDVYSGVQHYFRILQFRYGGEEQGEMMIFLLHCYSTAAMPYMGARSGEGGQ